MATTTIGRSRIGKLVRYFLRLGCLGFGGLVARVSQMERELIGKQWLTKQEMGNSQIPGAADARFQRHEAGIQGG